MMSMKAKYDAAIKAGLRDKEAGERRAAAAALAEIKIKANTAVDNAIGKIPKAIAGGKKEILIWAGQDSDPVYKAIMEILDKEKLPCRYYKDPGELNLLLEVPKA